MLKVKYTYKYPISACVDRLKMSITRDQIEPNTIAKLQTLSEQIAVKRYADLTEKKWVVEAEAPVEFYSASSLLKDIPRDGLVAEYLFFEGAGTILHDTSQQSPPNDGTIYGMTFETLPTGKVVGRFDGVDDYVSCPKIDISGETSQITIEAWVNPSVISTYHRIVENELNYALILRPEGKIHFTLLSSDGLYHNVWVTTETLSTGQWYNIFAIYDGSGASGGKIYINSKRATVTAIWTGGWLALGTVLEIGRLANKSSQYFNGLIGLVRIYNRVLSESEIKEIYQLEAPLFGITP